MFYALWLWASGEKNLKRNLFYGGLTLFFLAFFVLSETRGGFIGLGAAVFAFFIFLAFKLPATRKWALPLLVAFIVISSILVYYRHSAFMQRFPGGRVFDIAFSGATVQTRLWTWGSAWQGFLERPLLGWGPENFTLVFDKYFNPHHYVPGQSSETWFDRAHNVFFDYLSETGFLGLLAYLGMFGVFYWEFFRKSAPVIERDISKELRVQKNDFIPGQTVVLRGLLLAMPVGYLVQGLALFDVLPIYINLFLFLAFSAWFYTQQ